MHDIVQELPALDAFLNTFFPLSMDAASLELMGDAAYVLEVIARHPFGYHWLHQRNALVRLDALKQHISSHPSSAAIDAVVAALLSLPSAPEPPQLPAWTPSTSPPGFTRFSSSIEEKMSASVLTARRAGVSAVDLLGELEAADTHDDFLSSLWHLHDLCSSDHSVAACIAAEGRWEVPFRKFIEVRQACCHCCGAVLSFATASSTRNT